MWVWLGGNLKKGKKNDRIRKTDSRNKNRMFRRF